MRLSEQANLVSSPAVLLELYSFRAAPAKTGHSWLGETCSISAEGRGGDLTSSFGASCQSRQPSCPLRDGQFLPFWVGEVCLQGRFVVWALQWKPALGAPEVQTVLPVAWSDRGSDATVSSIVRGHDAVDRVIFFVFFLSDRVRSLKDYFFFGFKQQG